jgi:hypothetical protein
MTPSCQSSGRRQRASVPFLLTGHAVVDYVRVLAAAPLVFNAKGRHPTQRRSAVTGELGE